MDNVKYLKGTNTHTHTADLMKAGLYIEVLQQRISVGQLQSNV